MCIMCRFILLSELLYRFHWQVGNEVSEEAKISQSHIHGKATHTHNPQTDGGSNFPKSCSNYFQAEDIKKKKLNSGSWRSRICRGNLSIGRICFEGLYQDVFVLVFVSSNNIITFEAILPQADRSPNRVVMFIIQSRALKINFFVFKKSVADCDDQFINKFHQTRCIKRPWVSLAWKKHYLLYLRKRPRNLIFFFILLPCNVINVFQIPTYCSIYLLDKTHLKIRMSNPLKFLNITLLHVSILPDHHQGVNVPIYEVIEYFYICWCCCWYDGGLRVVV